MWTDEVAELLFRPFFTEMKEGTVEKGALSNDIIVSS